MIKQFLKLFFKSENSAVAAIWYLFGTFLVQGINFFMIPVFTNLMSVSNYGMLSLCTMWVNIFCTFITLQVHGSINNAILEFGEPEIDKYVSSIQFVELISFACFFIIGLIFNAFFSLILRIPQNIFLILLITSFFQSCIQLQLSKFIAERKHKKYFLLSLIFTILTASLSVLGIIVQESSTKYYGKIYGNFMSATIIGTFVFIDIVMHGKTFLKKEYVSFCLSLTLPLILHGLAQIILGQSDRYMLKMFAKNGDYSVGIYSYAYTLGSIINVLWLAFNYAWVPWYYKKREINDSFSIKKIACYYFLIFTALTICFLMIAPEVIKIMTPKSYWNGINIIPLIVIGYYFMFLYSFPVNFEFYCKSTLWISVGTFFAAIINILLNYLLIPRYNEYGSAFATLVSYIALFIFHYIIARFVIKNYELNFRTFIIFLVPLVIFTFIYYFFINNLFLRWGICIFIIILFIIFGLRYYRKKRFTITQI